MDLDHVPTTLPLLEAGYDVLLEKPICPTREELLELLRTVRRTGRKLAIGHVLRYAPFYVAIKERLVAGDIGRVYAVQSTEAVSYHHMAAAFIRGRWAHRKTNPMLLAKCCHDLDLIAWYYSGIAPRYVSSFGARTVFTEDNAPPGSGTRCLVDCAIERECDYSARKHYLEQRLWGAYAWESIEHIAEPTDEDRERSLREDNPFGHCVWRTDGDAVDHQSVIIEFADGSTAAHNMITGPRGRAAACISGDRGRDRGLHGGRALWCAIPTRVRGTSIRGGRDLNVSMDMHGGGDMRLVEDFVRVVRGRSRRSPRPACSTRSTGT